MQPPAAAVAGGAVSLAWLSCGRNNHRSGNMKPFITLRTLLAILLSIMSNGSSAAEPVTNALPPMAYHWSGLLALLLFLLAMLLVSFEEYTHLRKSKPVILTAGIIWGLIGWHATQTETIHEAEQAVRHALLQYAELMLLILVVMTYINALGERRVFKTLRCWLANRGLTYRGLFWSTGCITFMLSPLLDNLSAALLVGALILVIEPDNRRFISLGCLNVVVAANAGGVFSPFGDITTLMVWQQDIISTTGPVGFWQFFHLALPALAAYLIPATLMQFALPRGRLAPAHSTLRMLRGSRRIMLLFLCAISTAVLFQAVLNLPAVIGMLTGLSYLQIFGYYLKVTHQPQEEGLSDTEMLALPVPPDGQDPFDVFIRVARAEWDTLLFIYGVALSVGGLGYIGYLSVASELLYDQWGPTMANVSIGLASSVLENVPAMYSVLNMMPSMSLGEWLLATLAIGTGGSLLAIGSAASVALMGQSNGRYTFFSHLKWTPVLLLAYAVSIWLHQWLNAALF